MNFDNKIILISGPTASGKSLLAINFAKEYNGVIINADSMQIYKGLPILSAQPNELEKNLVEHILYSYLDPNDNCNVFSWIKLAQESIDYARNKGKTPIIVGGTGMYISKIINGLSPMPDIDEVIRKDAREYANNINKKELYEICLKIDKDYVSRIEINDMQRLIRVYEIYKQTGKNISYFHSLNSIKLYKDEEFFHININLDRNLLKSRIYERFKKMYEENNVIEEVKKFKIDNKHIIDNSKNFLIFSTLGLKEFLLYIDSKISHKELMEKVIKSTNQYAKRQSTWFNNQFQKFDLIINNLNFEQIF